MSRILRILLFIIGILIFFEIGLYASYALISNEPVNPVELVSIQIDEVSDFVGSLTGEKKLSEQDTLIVSNDEDVALALNNLTNLSVNLNSVTAKVSNDNTGNQTVTLTALASKDKQATSGGAIIVEAEQTYSITATATGEVYSNGKVYINVSTISVDEKIVLYDQSNTTTGNNSLDDLIDYANNASKNNTTVNRTANTTNRTNNTR